MMTSDQVPERGGGSDAAAVKAFCRASRLRRLCEFRHVRQRGRKAVGRYAVVQAAKALDEHRRVAVVISRRYSRRAVKRNRARRLFREAYRLFLPELKPAWIVFRPRAAMRGIKLAALVDELRRLLGDLGLLRDPAGAGAGRDGEAS